MKLKDHASEPMTSAKEEVVEDHEMAPLDNNGETEALLSQPSPQLEEEITPTQTAETTSPKEIRGWLCASFAVEVFAIVSLTLFLRKWQ